MRDEPYRRLDLLDAAAGPVVVVEHRFDHGCHDVVGGHVRTGPVVVLHAEPVRDVTMRQLLFLQALSWSLDLKNLW